MDYIVNLTVLILPCLVDIAIKSLCRVVIRKIKKRRIKIDWGTAEDM